MVFRHPTFKIKSNIVHYEWCCAGDGDHSAELFARPPNEVIFAFPTIDGDDGNGAVTVIDKIGSISGLFHLTV